MSCVKQIFVQYVISELQEKISPQLFFIILQKNHVRLLLLDCAVAFVSFLDQIQFIIYLQLVRHVYVYKFLSIYSRVL